MRFNVRVPASSANLGPGFDTLAVAVNLFTDLDVESAPVGIEILGGPDLGGGDNLILRGIEMAADAAHRPVPGCRIRVASGIPVARGLGSSATAVVSGLVTGNRLMGEPLSEQRLFELAAEFEGHGDNVSASLFGGLTLSLMGDRGILFRRVPINGALRVVMFVPEVLAFTADARAVVPDLIPRSDAVGNVGRCALLVLSLMQGDRTALGEAMRDALHQPYRSRLFPHVAPMIEAAVDAGAHGASLSGAGPSVLSFVEPQHAPDVVAAFERVAVSRGVSGIARLLDIEYEGATILQPVGQRDESFL